MKKINKWEMNVDLKNTVLSEFRLKNTVLSEFRLKNTVLSEFLLLCVMLYIFSHTLLGFI